MTSFKTTLLVIFLTFQAQAKQVRTFLPVHYDPNQAAVVEQRLRFAEVSQDLPKQYQIPKDLISPVRDQGPRGTCAYFSTLAAVETYYISKSAAHAPLDLSVQCIVGVRNWMYDTKTFTRDDKPDFRPDPTGDLPESITKTISYEGIPAAANYSAAKCVYSDGSSKATSLDQYRKIFSETQNYGQNLTFDNNDKPTLDEIKALLVKNIPVVVGILVYQDYFDETTWTWAGVDHSDANLAGGHAVMLTGFETNSFGQTLFSFKNSWGTVFGSHGYGKINEDLLTHSWSYDPSFDFIVSVHD